MNARLLWIYDDSKSKPFAPIYEALASVLSSPSSSAASTSSTTSLNGALVRLSEAKKFVAKTPHFLSPTASQDARRRVQLAVVVDRVPIVAMSLNAYTIHRQSTSIESTAARSQTRRLSNKTATDANPNVNNNNNIDSLVFVGVVALAQLPVDIDVDLTSRMTSNGDEGEQEAVLEAIKFEGAALAPLLASLSETQCAAVLTNGAARNFVLAAAG